jgi:hypothetical protein
MNPIVQQILENIDNLSRELREQRPVSASAAPGNETNNQTQVQPQVTYSKCYIWLKYYGICFL